jgi:hypothetical protein
MEDPIQVGIHAMGTFDRTIHCGAYKEGTATVFRKFQGEDEAVALLVEHWT